MSTANTGGQPIDIRAPEDALPSQSWLEDDVFGSL